MLPRALLLAFVACIAVGGWIATYALWEYRRAAGEIGRLELRHFEEPTVVILGSGGAFENPSRGGPAIALGIEERVILVDAGRGVAAALRAAKIPVRQPETVYLTSLLPENSLGLADLLVTGWRTGRTRPLRVFGPPGTTALVRALESSQKAGVQVLAAQLGLPAQAATYEAFEAPQVPGSDEIPVRPARLEPGPFPALAYRFETRTGDVIVGGVGFGAAELAELAHGANVLVHGAVFLESVEAAIDAGVEGAERLRREASLELPLREVARIAESAGVGALVLVRLRPPPLFDFQFEGLVRESFSGRLLIAEDGDEIIP